MRLFHSLVSVLLIALGFNLATVACAQTTPGNSTSSTEKNAQPVDISADGSLEWYQDQNLYVARGNAKAIRGSMVVDADTLMAHARDTPETVAGTPKPPKDKTANKNGDIDKMTAEGNVRITDERQRVTGEHALYDLDKHYMIVTGNNLRYETEKEVVTAKDSLEYYEDKKIAVARGHAIADKGQRHVEADVLTAEFRDAPNGEQELWKMTAKGHVTVITKGDVARGDNAVYDIARDIAILSGNVKITRADGTQLTGDVGETDFKNNQSRLMNEGHGRVRALLTSKTGPKAAGKPASVKASNP